MPTVALLTNVLSAGPIRIAVEARGRSARRTHHPISDGNLLARAGQFDAIKDGTG